MEFLKIVFINKIKSILSKFTYDTQHLFGLLFSRNTKKTHTDQSILQFFYSVRMKTTFKPSKIAAAKLLFSSVYVIDTTCPDECFFFHIPCDSWKTLFL